MEPLYVDVGQSVEVGERTVRLGDVVTMTCASEEIVSRLKDLTILHIKDETYGRYVISTLALVKKIHGVYPKLQVVCVGEPRFLLTYRAPREKSRTWEWIKIAFLCLAGFFGAAFAVMTFNNDVGVSEVFAQLYELFTGQKGDGFTALEISYSVGIGIGIVFFFNHFVGRKLTVDPTPIEVEMAKYEKDMNTMLMESEMEEERNVDVD